MKSFLLGGAALAVTASVCTAQTDNLLFTGLNKYAVGRTLSGSGGTNLTWARAESVMVVEPNPATAYSAETFASTKGWQAVMGDADGDAFFYQQPLFDRIDALLTLVPSSVAPTMRDLYLSPSISAGIPAGRALEPGDVAAIQPNGALHYFLTGAQVQTALDMANVPNVDAIEKDAAGNLFLSFEDDETILGGTVVLQDGGVAVIPASGVSYASDGTVDSMLLASGFVALTEAEVDAMVVASGYRDAWGFAPLTIVDLDGLHEDPNGGTFTVSWGGNDYDFPNLLFSGENLVGCGVLSTSAGGSLASMNGAPLASSSQTNHTVVGLAPAVDGADSLNGLETSSPAPCRFVLDSPDTDASAGPQSVSLDWGGADPNGLVWLWQVPVPRVAGIAPASTPLGGTSCFPDVYGGSPLLFFTSDAAGFGRFTATVGGLGVAVAFQMYGLKDGGVVLGAPVVFEL